MNRIASTTGFHTLTPDVVINRVENVLDRRLTGLCRSLNSYINRVFELQGEDGEGIIAKFYRPGRWSFAALNDEHGFLFELEERDIPVIPPMRLPSGESLAEYEGTYLAIFPKKLGRALDEPSFDQWEVLGRLLARVHNVGAMHPPRNRITMTPDTITRSQLNFLLQSDVIPREYRREYEQVVNELIAQVVPMFRNVELIRIHGDCHRGNIVDRPGESLYLIDFDDMAIGPPVQDLWMLLPDVASKSRAEIEMFLEGYNIFRQFDRSTLNLIEALRAMRYVHFTAWCAAQAVDATGAARLVPGWGSASYWRESVRDLREQIEEIKFKKQDIEMW
jgi:Ser/Thr protein kinase RdoA (MazF antagonist)